jgi:pyruvate/2-oxoglutarate dehydrogenase complex dihydrolipoamide dehydrogenase (E3) component
MGACREEAACIRSQIERRMNDRAHALPQPLLPLDRFNQRLQQQIAPTDWVAPEPADRYHLVVIGAGTAGLVAAAGAAGVGARVAIVERSLMGGDCLNVGCVPSKAILAAARHAKQIRRSDSLGVSATGVVVDFPAVMNRMREKRASISPNDSAHRFKQLGIDVFFGQAQFATGDQVRVGDRTLRYHRAVIASGGRALVPAIDGLADAMPLTNESLFSLTSQPTHLVVVGGGPIGVEMAQAFAQLGSKVTIIDSNPTILAKEDREAAERVQHALQADGVEVWTQSTVRSVRMDGDRRYVRIEQRGRTELREIECDQILVAAGRQPNVEGLELESVGVQCDSKRGIVVDDRLQTTNPKIFAAGDVCSPLKFTHAADFQSRMVVQNALFFGRARASALVVPWCTYTNPELARVGLTAQEATERDIAHDVYVQSFDELDRAILDDQTDGFVKVITKKGTDRILGATIVASHAGDLISQFSLAMTNRIGLKKFAKTIYPYPTQAEAIRKLGDQFNRTRLTPFAAAALRRILRWRF